MHKIRYLAVLSVLAVGWAGPVSAEDQLIDTKPCDFFCKLWRNVSRDAQVSSPTPIDRSPVSSIPLPDATEGAERPQPSRVVQQRGVIVIQTAAERAAIRRRKIALERETDKHIVDGEAMMHRIFDPKGAETRAAETTGASTAK